MATRPNTNALDLTVPANPPYLTSTESTHTYDAADRLVNTSSTMTYMGTSTVSQYAYTADEAGRCVEIASVVTSTSTTRATEKLTYMTDGGMRSEKTSTTTSGTNSTTTVVVTALTLDAQGRWLAVERDGSSWGGSADGTPDIIDAYSYAADGTITVTHLDFSSDVPNDYAEYKGRSGRVDRSDLVVPPQCTALDDAIPRIAGDACRYPMRAWNNRLIW
jgi:hypothetical protein